MSRMVVGLGPAPDPRGYNTNDPKVLRRYKRADRLFRGAEKAFNTLKKLRKRRKKQKGTPEAGRIQRRINALRKRKDKLLKMSRSIKIGERRIDKYKDKGRDRDRDRGRDRDIVRVRDRGIDRGRDRDIVSDKMVSIRDRGEDRGRKSTGGFFSGRDKDRSTREEGGRRSTGGLFGGSREFSSKKGRSGRVYVQSTEKKDDRGERR